MLQRTSAINKLAGIEEPNWENWLMLCTCRWFDRLLDVWFWNPSGRFTSSLWRKHGEATVLASVFWATFFPNLSCIHWALVLPLALPSNPHTKLVSRHSCYRFPDSLKVFILFPLLYKSRDYTFTHSRAWLSKCKERGRKKRTWPLFCRLLCYHRKYRHNYFIFKLVPYVNRKKSCENGIMGLNIIRHIYILVLENVCNQLCKKGRLLFESCIY